MADNDRPDPLALLDDKPPSKGKRTSGSFRSLVALLVAIGGVIGSLAALVRAYDESVTKESYKTLVSGISDVQNKCDQEHAQDHEQIVAMRSYLDGFINGRGTPTQPLAVPTATTSPSPSPRLSFPSAIPKSVADSGAPPPAATIFVAPPPPAAPAAPAPPPWKAPDFDTVQRKARAD
jgi:hypothetical protein